MNTRRWQKLEKERTTIDADKWEMMTKKEKLAMVMNEDKRKSGTKETPKKARLKKAKELKRMW